MNAIIGDIINAGGRLSSAIDSIVQTIKGGSAASFGERFAALPSADLGTPSRQGFAGLNNIQSSPSAGVLDIRVNGESIGHTGEDDDAHVSDLVSAAVNAKLNEIAPRQSAAQ